MSTRIPYIVNPDGTPGSRWEPQQGCDGCDVSQCWAATDAWRMAHHPNPRVAERFTGLVEKTPDGRIRWMGTSRWYPEKLYEPLSRRKPTTYAVCFGGDLFAGAHYQEHQAQVFLVMVRASQHTFLVLTKQAERMRQFMVKWHPWLRACVRPACKNSLGAFPSNIWFGVSVSGPQDVGRVKTLLEIPVPHRWVSWEPCVEAVDFSSYLGPEQIEWLVMGCESGPGRRLPKCEQCHGKGFLVDPYPCGSGMTWHYVCEDCFGTGYAAWAWAREARDACRKAQVPFFLKQLPIQRGSVLPNPSLDECLHLDLPWRS